MLYSARIVRRLNSCSYQQDMLRFTQATLTSSFPWTSSVKELMGNLVLSFRVPKIMRFDSGSLTSMKNHTKESDALQFIRDILKTLVVSISLLKRVINLSLQVQTIL